MNSRPTQPGRRSWIIRQGSCARIVPARPLEPGPWSRKPGMITARRRELPDVTPLAAYEP